MIQTKNKFGCTRIDNPDGFIRIIVSDDMIARLMKIYGYFYPQIVVVSLNLSHQTGFINCKKKIDY